MAKVKEPLKSKESKAKQPLNLSSEDLERTIMDYLRKMNRPYSATDLHMNLNLKNKTVVQNMLTTLAEKNDILCKQTVFVWKQVEYTIHGDVSNSQDSMEAPSKEGLVEMDQQAEVLQKQCKDCEESIKQLSNQLNALVATLPSTSLEERNLELDKLTSSVAARLEPLRSGTSKTYSPAESTRIDQMYVTLRQEWKKRRKTFKEMFETYADTREIRKPNFPEAMEDLGIDTDPIAFEIDPLADTQVSM